jgi:hypothetical protein
LAQQQVKVKKVNAYPIPAKIKFASGEVTVQIMKLAPIGFLCEIPNNQLQPGEKFECSFELPVIHKTVTEPIVAVKIYNQWSGGAKDGASGAGGVHHLAEFHFVALSAAGREATEQFLRQLGNHKPGSQKS